MDFFYGIIVLIGITLPNVLTYNVVFGKGKILHFGTVGVSLFIAYTLVITLIATQSFVAAFLTAFLGSVLISLFFAWLSLRLEADSMGVLSIAVHLALLAVVLNWNALTRGALGIPRIPRLPFFESMQHMTLFSAMLCVLTYVIVRFIDRSAFGRKLQALAEHEWHAASLGVDRSRVHTMAFLIAGIGAVFSSFLFVEYLTLLHPNDYQFSALVFIIMVVVAGGPGSVFGVTLSSILLVLLKEALRFVPLAPGLVGPVRLMLFGLILFIAVWFRRDSVFPRQRSV